MLAANLGCAGARRLDALAVSFSPLRSRVRAAAERVACGEHVDWAGEAKLGYADQPHVIREFRAQIGETPGIRGALGKRAPSLGKDEQLRPEAETSRGCKRGVGGRTRLADRATRARANGGLGNCLKWLIFRWHEPC
jgi:hypothetical protein